MPDMNTDEVLENVSVESTVNPIGKIFGTAIGLAIATGIVFLARKVGTKVVAKLKHDKGFTVLDGYKTDAPSTEPIIEDTTK